jgi:hypothetical protein
VAGDEDRDGAQVTGTGRGWADRLAWLNRRWWWLLLLGWVPPYMLGGWWWLLLIPVVPATILTSALMAADQEQRRADERAAEAAVPPGTVLDRAADRQTDRKGDRQAGWQRVSPSAVSPSPAPPVTVVSPVTAVAVFGTAGTRVTAMAQATGVPVLAVGRAGGRAGGRAEVWTGVGAPDPSCVATLPHPAALTAVAFSPDGRLLVTAGVEGTATVWDAAPRVWRPPRSPDTSTRPGPWRSASTAPDLPRALTTGPS